MSKNQNRDRNNNQENQKKRPNFTNDQLGENMTEFSEEVNPNNQQRRRQKDNKC